MEEFWQDDFFCTIERARMLRQRPERDFHGRIRLSAVTGGE